MGHSSGTQGIFSRKETHRSFYLPRLSREFYQGNSVVHWTMPVANREKGWLNPLFHTAFRELMVHAQVRESVFCPAYCLMPDHIHFVWMGLHSDSDQRNGLKFLREHLAPALNPYRFQHQAYDHVLHDEERKRNVFASICFYILSNPVRAGLIKETDFWPYRGALVPGYPKLNPLDEGFWPLF